MTENERKHGRFPRRRQILQAHGSAAGAGKLFWSVTAYDAQTRSEVQTDQNKAALRSLFELKDVSMSEPTELWFGPTAPAGKKGQWIKTTPGRGWSAYMRIYGPEDAAFDGSWKPGDFEELK